MKSTRYMGCSKEYRGLISPCRHIFALSDNEKSCRVREIVLDSLGNDLEPKRGCGEEASDGSALPIFQNLPGGECCAV